jgi:hypothetical protein
MEPRRRAETHLFGSMMSIERVIMRKMDRRYPKLSKKKVRRAKKKTIRKILCHLEPKERGFSCSGALPRHERKRRIDERRTKTRPSPKGNAPGPGSEKVPMLY